MPKYRVKPDRRHGVGGMHGPGAIIELDALSAAAFSDKLERYFEADPKAADAPMPEATPVAELFDHKIAKLLEAAELDSIETIADTTDEELLAIPGIGPKTLETIRTKIKER